MKEYYKYVFSVVLYKNMQDVIAMIESVQKEIDSYKIILVNNYFNKETSNIARKIAEKYNCDFIEVENKGYGVGNNCAVEYASRNYEFDYFVVSNSDIQIKKFDDSTLLNPDIPAIYGPNIICKTGKQQNPMWIKKNNFLEWLQYIGEKNKCMFFNYSPIVVRKVERMFFLKTKSKKSLTRIYAAHGAFCIISKEAINRIAPPYSEKMFLFFEEAWLANKAYKNNVEVYYCPTIEINHSEDGSMKISNVNVSTESRKSVMYYYQHKED